MQRNERKIKAESFKLKCKAFVVYSAKTKFLEKFHIIYVDQSTKEKENKDVNSKNEKGHYCRSYRQ